MPEASFIENAPTPFYKYNYHLAFLKDLCLGRKTWLQLWGQMNLGEVKVSWLSTE